MKIRFTSTYLYVPDRVHFQRSEQHLFLSSVKRILLAVSLLITLLSSSNLTTANAEAGKSFVKQPNEQVAATAVAILVDDFKPQRFQGSPNPSYFYNRLNGDRGALNNSIVDLRQGQVKVTVNSTCPPAPQCTWGGFYESLNHPDREHLSINFSAILPPQILPAYQSQITGITVHVVDGTPGRLFKLELKDADVRWSNQINLRGGSQVINLPLPALANVHSLNLVLPNAVPGDYVIIDRISFTASTQVPDSATRAFVWSYAMLLNNWNPNTGLIRDKAKDVSGEFDAIQATGSLAAATAFAEQLGVINRTDAAAIVNKISDTLLNKVPRFHGLWPHWVTVSDSGVIAIVGPDGRNDLTGQPCQPGACTDHNGDGLNDVTNLPCDRTVCTDKGTEWSSVDTVIAAIGLLDAQYALGRDTSRTEQLLRNIEWHNLQLPKGISHGYDFIGKLIPYAWDTFGGETWLAELAYAASTGEVINPAYASPPTADGSGFIDELAWLFVRSPVAKDHWSNDWNTYRANAANTQITYYPRNYPNSCFSQRGLFGLSAAEVPDLSLVTEGNIYQAFGVGGRSKPVNDGLKKEGQLNGGVMGAPVIVPHYSALIASLRSADVIRMWDWLISQGYFSPLNNVESLMYSPNSTCISTEVRFNDLQGSWNLALQTLGWGRYLAQQKGFVPATWLATIHNSFLNKGYVLLTTYAISGNAQIAGVALSYSDGISKTALSDGTGNYSFAVPPAWTGMVRPYKTGYLFTPLSRNYNNLQGNQTAQNYTAQACVTCADVNALIGGTLIGRYTLNISQSTRDSYAGVNDGPVKMASTNSVRLIGAERVIYKSNGVNTSFWEMMGLPDNQLSTIYWLPWYNNIDLDTQLRFGNVSGSTATVHVLIGGVEMTGSPFNLASGASIRKSFAVNNGPVKIVSNQKIVAAERVIYSVNGKPTSFSELMALPNSQLSNTYWLPWYDNVGLDSQLRFANVSGSTATVHVFINGVEMTGSPFILGVGQSTRQSFAVRNGPVKIVSDQNIVAAERLIYKVNGIPTSFSEMMALPNSQLNTIHWLPWYNNVDLDTELRLANVTGSLATVHVLIGGVEMTGSPYTLAAGQTILRRYAVNNGPVKIVSNQNIVVTERVIYKVNNINTSFSEMMALPNAFLDSIYWLPWYNNVDLDTQLRFGVP